MKLDVLLLYSASARNLISFIYDKNIIAKKKVLNMKFEAGFLF